MFMKRKTLSFILATMMATGMYAQYDVKTSLDDFPIIIPEYVSGGELGWSANWFVGIQGGTNAFVGNPLGCGDLFDRVKPNVSGYFGKFLSNAWALRFEWQGLKLINSEFEDDRYNNIHADLMYNLTRNINLDCDGVPRWDCMPYLGLGVIMNTDKDVHPFGLSYGVMTRFKVTTRFHITLDVGGTTTFCDFDGCGDRNAFGDNLLSASLGVAVTVGKLQNRRIVDAQPYIWQNELLRSRVAELQDWHVEDQRTIEEMKKILKIRGLLEEKYEDPKKTSPKNNYKGLLSLRERMARNSLPAQADNVLPVEENYLMTNGDSISAGSGYRILNIPVFFFFSVNTADLTDRSQLVNLEELVHIADKYGLDINVSGAADSATGTPEINDRLSEQRTEYIVSELQKRGVSPDRIFRHAQGGISLYDTNEANRNSMVYLMKN